MSDDRTKGKGRDYLVEGIIPAHNPSDVAQHFECATANHGDCEANEAPREGRLHDETA